MYCSFFSFSVIKQLMDEPARSYEWNQGSIYRLSLSSIRVNVKANNALSTKYEILVSLFNGLVINDEIRESIPVLILDGSTLTYDEINILAERN